MSKGNYIQVKGSFVTEEEYRFSLQESDSFLFTEKIRVIRSAFPFFSETIALIKLKFNIFNQSIPDFMTNDASVLKRQMERTLTKNKHFLGAVLSITFYQAGEQIDYTIRSEKTDSAGYELNEKGLFIAVFDRIQKAQSTLSTISLGSEMVWAIAENYLKEFMVDQLLIVNSRMQVLEIPQSNIYLIKDKIIKGASPEQGAYCDVTKPLMQEIFKELGLYYSEEDGITIKDLQEAEEIFSANSLDGIKWILGLEGKRYFNNTTRKISEVFSQKTTN